VRAAHEPAPDLPDIEFFHNASVADALIGSHNPQKSNGNALK